MEGQFFVVDMIMCISQICKPDQSSKCCHLTTIHVKSLLNDSMTLKFYNSFLKRKDDHGRGPFNFFILQIKENFE